MIDPSRGLIARLNDPVQAHKCLSDYIWREVKAWLVCNQSALELTIKPAKRNKNQNARLHATIADIAQQLDWCGKRRDVDTWKRLFVASWIRAKGQTPEILPALDGCGVDIIFHRTSELSKAECADLTTWIEAWGSERGVEWSDVPDAVSR